MRIVRDTFIPDLQMTRQMIRQFGTGHRAGRVMIRDDETGEEHQVSVSMRPDGRMVVSAVGWSSEFQRCLLIQEGSGRDHALALRLIDGKVSPDTPVPIHVLRYMPDPIVPGGFQPGTISG